MSVYSRLEVKIDPEGVTKLDLNLNDLYKQIVRSTVHIKAINPPSIYDHKRMGCDTDYLINKLIIHKNGINVCWYDHLNDSKHYPIVAHVPYEYLDKFLNREQIITTDEYGSKNLTKLL